MKWVYVEMLSVAIKLIKYVEDLLLVRSNIDIHTIQHIIPMT